VIPFDLLRPSRLNVEELQHSVAAVLGWQPSDSWWERTHAVATPAVNGSRERMFRRTQQQFSAAVDAVNVHDEQLYAAAVRLYRSRWGVTSAGPPLPPPPQPRPSKPPALATAAAAEQRDGGAGEYVGWLVVGGAVAALATLGVACRARLRRIARKT
jgi:hypothetical protein